MKLCRDGPGELDRSGLGGNGPVHGALLLSACLRLREGAKPKSNQSVLCLCLRVSERRQEKSVCVCV